MISTQTAYRLDPAIGWTVMEDAGADAPQAIAQHAEQSDGRDHVASLSSEGRSAWLERTEWVLEDPTYRAVSR